MRINFVTYRTDNIVERASNTTQSDSQLAADLDPIQPNPWMDPINGHVCERPCMPAAVASVGSNAM